MEVTRGSTCTLVEGITGYESQSTGFGMMLDVTVLLAHSLGAREDMIPRVLIQERIAMSLGLICDSENEMGLQCCQGPSLDLHRVFQLLNLDMARVHWIRCIHLYVSEPREGRLPDDRHACWKKRQ